MCGVRTTFAINLQIFRRENVQVIKNEEWEREGADLGTYKGLILLLELVSKASLREKKKVELQHFSNYK